MNRLIFNIVHDNNKLAVFNTEEKMLFNSIWFMEFGKSIAEIFDNQQNTLFTITKRFQFWKWKMVYKLLDQKKDNFLLTAQNARNTIYNLDYESSNYKVLLHYKQRMSILKNSEKIAELDASFKHKNSLNSIQLTTSNSNELKIIFTLFSCMKIGESAQVKPVLNSQKQLEPNPDPWT